MTWVIPAAYLLFLAVLLHRYTHRDPHLRSYPCRTNGPLVSIIVPARNEAANIATCLRSILTTAYESVEIIVVDDRSTDGTAAIIDEIARSRDARGRVHLVRGADLPAGWFGKPWALVQGCRVAKGTILLFTDADTFHGAELIPRCIGALEGEQVDLVTVIPRQEMVTFWERLVQPHVFLVLASRVGGLDHINKTRVEWDGIANGQFILTTRVAYETVGTHEAVKDQVAEDLALAQAYVRHGLNIFLVHGPEHMTTRMYRSLAEIVEGWSKNLAIGVPFTLPPIPWLRRAAPYLMWLPVLAWVAPVWWALHGSGWAIAAVAISVATWAVVYWAEKAPVRYALLYPFGAALVAYIMLRSAWRGGRKIVWRGREYGTG